VGFDQLYFATGTVVLVEDTNECSMTNHFCETARAMHCTKEDEDDSNDLGPVYNLRVDVKVSFPWEKSLH
jgi:hypothetical protein